jgi:hypothetical protein
LRFEAINPPPVATEGTEATEVLDPRDKKTEDLRKLIWAAILYRI